MEAWLIPILVVGTLLFLGFLAFRAFIRLCAPSEVLIITGARRSVAGRTVGYKVIKGGRGFCIPLMNRVDRLDLTNMVIDVSAVNAYSRGGIPLTVQGVANVKIAGHEPLLNNAIERFLGKSRQEIMQIAKATLEGSLRGVLATMTPEQVNEDKILFAERLVQEVEQDMTNLGLVVDTMKIQNVQDEVRYLDSIGRKRNAEIVSRARIAEAIAKADSVVRDAQNREQEVRAQVSAQLEVAKAEAQRKLVDIKSQRNALIAEEQATVAAQVAQALAELEVQKARVIQVKQRLEADVIAPSKADAEKAENDAKASTASILEEGRARADALRNLAEAWEKAGPKAREVLLMQKLDKVIGAITDTVAKTEIEKVTMIDSGAPNFGQGGGSIPLKLVSTLEQVKQVLGVDLVEKLKTMGDAGAGARAIEAQSASVIETPTPLQPEPPAVVPSPKAVKEPPKFTVRYDADDGA
ncbi:MAG: flotillin family protein [Fimbriimonadaceae bacterium]